MLLLMCDECKKRREALQRALQEHEMQKALKEAALGLAEILGVKRKEETKNER